eukprot:TRINITY_DN13293_c1_g5_i1.p1 TRINITY_DN13293_c1_g5~~TRINITY_DN13293_c1_g5_i1.p1  ORF type:complete len:1036 (+),score=256.32 TRINITY_DN13293_c1_g5_i1:811-3918(+)
MRNSRQCQPARSLSRELVAQLPILIAGVAPPPPCRLLPALPSGVHRAGRASRPCPSSRRNRLPAAVPIIRFRTRLQSPLLFLCPQLRQGMGEGERAEEKLERGEEMREEGNEEVREEEGEAGKKEEEEEEEAEKVEREEELKETVEEEEEQGEEEVEEEEKEPEDGDGTSEDSDDEESSTSSDEDSDESSSSSDEDEDQKKKSVKTNTGKGRQRDHGVHDGEMESESGEEEEDEEEQKVDGEGEVVAHGGKRRKATPRSEAGSLPNGHQSLAPSLSQKEATYYVTHPTALNRLLAFSSTPSSKEPPVLTTGTLANSQAKASSLKPSTPSPQLIQNHAAGTKKGFTPTSSSVVAGLEPAGKVHATNGRSPPGMNEAAKQGVLGSSNNHANVSKMTLKSVPLSSQDKEVPTAKHLAFKQARAPAHAKKANPTALGEGANSAFPATRAPLPATEAPSAAIARLNAATRAALPAEGAPLDENVGPRSIVFALAAGRQGPSLARATLATAIGAPSLAIQAPSAATRAPAPATRAPLRATKAPPPATRAPSASKGIPLLPKATNSTATGADAPVTEAPSAPPTAPTAATEAPANTALAPSVATGAPFPAQRAPSSVKPRGAQKGLKRKTGLESTKAPGQQQQQQEEKQQKPKRQRKQQQPKQMQAQPLQELLQQQQQQHGQQSGDSPQQTTQQQQQQQELLPKLPATKRQKNPKQKLLNQGSQAGKDSLQGPPEWPLLLIPGLTAVNKSAKLPLALENNDDEIPARRKPSPTAPSLPLSSPLLPHDRSPLLGASPLAISQKKQQQQQQKKPRQRKPKRGATATSETIETVAATAVPTAAAGELAQAVAVLRTIAAPAPEVAINAKAALSPAVGAPTAEGAARATARAAAGSVVVAAKATAAPHAIAPAVTAATASTAAAAVRRAAVEPGTGTAKAKAPAVVSREQQVLAASPFPAPNSHQSALVLEQPRQETARDDRGHEDVDDEVFLSLLIDTQNSQVGPQIERTANREVPKKVARPRGRGKGAEKDQMQQRAKAGRGRK